MKEKIDSDFDLCSHLDPLNVDSPPKYRVGPPPSTWVTQKRKQKPFDTRSGGRTYGLTVGSGIRYRTPGVDLLLRGYSRLIFT